jgi:uncharacterized membrane protein
MDTKQIKFGEWIEKGLQIYKENIGVLILSSLVAVVLSCVTFGVLAGPMMAGLVLIALQLIDQKGSKPEVGKVFQGFTFFLQSFLFMLVWGGIMVVAGLLLNLILCVGMVLAYVLTIALSTLLMFAMFMIVDKGLAFWPASMASLNEVKANFWPLLGFYVVSSLLSGVGSILCGIGVVITLPIGLCACAVAYRDLFPKAVPPVAPVASPAA